MIFSALRRTPKDKMDRIRREQTQGKLWIGCSRMEPCIRAPALAPRRICAAGSSAFDWTSRYAWQARRRGNYDVRGESLIRNPTKLIEIVEIGKQLLMTRGARTTFPSTVYECVQILCYHSGHVFNIIHGAGRKGGPLAALKYHAIINAGVGDFVSSGLQRADHCRIDCHCITGHQISARWEQPFVLRRNLLIYDLGPLSFLLRIKIIDVIITLFA